MKVLTVHKHVLFKTFHLYFVFLKEYIRFSLTLASKASLLYNC